MWTIASEECITSTFRVENQQSKKPECSRRLWNVGSHTDYTALYPRKWQLSNMMSLSAVLRHSQPQLYKICPFIYITCLRRTLNLCCNLYNDFLMTNWFTQLYLVTLYSLVNCRKMLGYRFKWSTVRILVQLPRIPRVLIPALHGVWGADSTLWSYCS
jgi:hypothetical protein